jgi:hypothetical protein
MASNEVILCPRCYGSRNMRKGFTLDCAHLRAVVSCQVCEGKGIVEACYDYCRGLGHRKYLATPMRGMSGLRQVLLPWSWIKLMAEGDGRGVDDEGTP